MGSLNVGQGKVFFAGDADESALIFASCLMRRNSQQWAELEKRARHYDEFIHVIKTAKTSFAVSTPVDLESLFKIELYPDMFATMFAGEFVSGGP
ncbi:hypothetical protein QM042_02185 [Escherichia coli]